MMRESLLERNPELGPVTVPLLVGLANAIEREAVERYTRLAQVMEQRGEPEVAAAFRRMLDEERAHVDAVQRWTIALGEETPDPAQFRWRLPADLSRSWDEAAGSARLTPYRAFALAADNEQRAFALYSYLAAAADDPKVAAQAELLAHEELRHAALMRRWRRDAWHRERRHAPSEPPVVTSIDQLHALLARREAAIAGCHRAVADRLRALGDERSAVVVEEALRSPAWPPEAHSTAPADAIVDSDNPVRLLLAAQAPLEDLSDTLEAVMRRIEGELFAAAEKALGNVIARIAKIALQVERRLRASEPVTPAS
ncbi:MAG: ferritin family protein [Burkholderiales bacterium]|nr:ferritin family protein [Burkholderiales bacterium]